MADTKLGWSQLDKPAPLYYRRFINAYTIVVAPAIVGLVTAWGVSTLTLARTGAVVIFSIALVKGVGMVLGNGQIYSPSNQVVDAQASKN
jgi:hypothetical protein